ncbi:MAG: 3-phosphoshikimate 1-carboxyvinyltransferase [Candidatus Nanopelagicales bacterium]|nr:3-phosphoshikimate 1-carboxyvinyltransferase [Candidatus Nanopelagicales bacterium]
MTPPWPAPAATRPIDATVNVPGSKSATNRALIIAALSTETSTIEGALSARDTELMMDALTALGTGFHRERSVIRVAPRTLTGPTVIDCGLAGTVMRFVPPVAALATGEIRFEGDRQARSRPVGPLLGALRALGVVVTGDGLPFAVTGAGHVTGGEVAVDASSSSQFVSGLLLAGARFDQGLIVSHRGDPIPSRPHLDMTVDMLRAAGARVNAEQSDPRDCRWQVEPGELRLGSLRIEPDLSNAAVFLAAAMVAGGTVRIPGWPEATNQAGDSARTIFEELGAQTVRTPTGLTLTGPDFIPGADLDLRETGELTPTMAAVCLFATGPSRLRGIGHLRGHETDRLAALAREIERLGGRVSVTDDALRIDPKPLHAADLDSYADHRMATFGAIVGLVVPGVRVHGIESTTKTLPGFATLWSNMLAAGVA